MTIAICAGSPDAVRRCAAASSASSYAGSVQPVSAGIATASREAPLVAISPISALTTGTSFGPAKVIAPGTAPIGIAPAASTSAS